MRSSTCARLDWFLPAGREAYAVKTVLWLPDGSPFPLCLRCGSAVSPRGTGVRRALTVEVRDRGTAWRNKARLFAHRGCVPLRGVQPQPIIRARSLRSRQVTA